LIHANNVGGPVMIGVMGRLARPSNRTLLALALIFVTATSAFAVGSTFNRGEETLALQVGETGYKPGYEAVSREKADAAAAAAAASDDAKAAASGLSSPWGWLFSSMTDGAIDENAAELAEAFAERMVVFTAKIELEVEDVDSTVDDIRLLTERHGGFIATVSTRSGGGAITVRVPQKRFYDAVSEIEALGDVVNRDLKGEDVTEDYVDLQARLSNLQKQEERLVGILEMCTTVEDVLKVEKELERVRGEVEGLTGNIQYLESRVELATITVLLNEFVEKKATWLAQVDWGAPVNAGLQALFTILQGLLAMAIVLGPFAAVGVPAYYLYKRVNRKKNAQ